MGLGNVDKLVHIEVSDDHMSAALIIEAGINPADLSVHLLLEKMDAIGLHRPASFNTILQGIINRYIATACERLECQIADGVPPVPGKHAELVLVSHEQQHANVDANAKIDHRECSHLKTVSAGEVIAKIIPPGKGVDGRDVFAQVVTAPKGKDIEVKTDETAELKSDGTVIAKRSGIVERNGNRIRVNHRLAIGKSVDYGTGNIHFPGDVEIQKGIRDCFKVEAGGNIVVHDLVDAAHLVAGGTIVLQHGIAAREHGSLRAARDIKALYIKNVNASAGRDVHVDREITACNLQLGRSLLAPNATILRTHVVSASTCIVGEVGSQLSTANTTHCKLSLGELPGLQELLKKAAPVALASKEHIDKATNRLRDLKSVGGKTSAAQAELLTEAQFTHTQFANMHQKTCGLIRKLHNLVVENAKACLHVNRCIHPGTIIEACGREFEVTKQIHGPCIIEQNATGHFEVVPTRNGVPTDDKQPLTRFARETKVGDFVNPSEILRQLGIEPLKSDKVAA
ncbi:MAG: FapA family protein [Phycisphaerales bacterium]